MPAGGDDERLVPGQRGGLGRLPRQPVVRTKARPAHERGGELPAFGGHPACAGGGKLDGHGAARAHERGHEVAPVEAGRAQHQRTEKVVQLLGTAQLRAGLRCDPRHDTRVERGKIARLEGQSPSRRDRPRAAFLQGGVVQEGVGTPVQDLLGQDRRDDRVDAARLHVAGADPGEDVGQALEVHRLRAAVDERLAHDRVVRDLHRAGDVLLARGKGRKDRGREVVRLHALDGRRDPPAPAVAGGDERARQVPPPAGPEHWRREHRLDQRLAHGCRGQEAEHLLQGE